MLATELTRDIGRGVERVIKEQCLESLLDRATDIVDAAARSGTLPPVADIGGAPSRPWTRSAWNSVVSSPVAARFPREQMAQLALVYEDIQELSDTNKQEANAWTDVSAMIGPGRRMDPVLDNALHSALGRARMANRTMAILGGQMARAAQRIDLPYGDGSSETLDIFPATAPDAPVLVYIHGGYWRSLDKSDSSMVAPAFVDRGVCVVVPNYALCPGTAEQPVCIADVALQMVRALEWTWRNIAAHGGDPSRITVSGHSAGGHLALMAGMLVFGGI